jgi:hypothetical protein
MVRQLNRSVDSVPGWLKLSQPYPIQFQIDGNKERTSRKCRLIVKWSLNMEQGTKTRSVILLLVISGKTFAYSNQDLTGYLEIQSQPIECSYRLAGPKHSRFTGKIDAIPLSIKMTQNQHLWFTLSRHPHGVG